MGLIGALDLIDGTQIWLVALIVSNNKLQLLPMIVDLSLNIFFCQFF
jgi:hypothetical protein